jgi:hypothetical protein
MKDETIFHLLMKDETIFHLLMKDETIFHLLMKDESSMTRGKVRTSGSWTGSFSILQADLPLEQAIQFVHDPFCSHNLTLHRQFCHQETREQMSTMVLSRFSRRDFLFLGFGLDQATMP